MHIKGSLCAAIKQMSCVGKRKIGVLVVDMDQPGPLDSVGKNIYDVLLMARLLDLPVWLIETGVCTNPLIKSALPIGTTTIQKEYFNAFAETRLNEKINAHGCTELVVMGATAVLCVMNTVMGGIEFVVGKQYDGAVQYGYRILTSQHVISGDVCWGGESGINFYDAL